jgi:single-strand DNA-binding protein
MAGSLNKVLLIGNVGRDADIRTATDGRKVASFSIATSDTWKDKTSGERKERTEWHKIVVFNDRLVEIVEKYVTKGRKVWLEGSLQTRKWTDRQSVDHYTTEIVLQQFRGDVQILEPIGSGRPPPADNPDDYGHTNPSAQPYSARHDAPGTGNQGAADLDDEIPF